MRSPSDCPGSRISRLTAGALGGCVALACSLACAPVVGDAGGPRLAAGKRASVGTLALKRAMAEASDLFLAGDFEGARRAFRRLAVAGDDSRVATRARYSWGRSELALGRPGAARLAFARALEAAPRGLEEVVDLRAYALAGLADVALASGRPAEAIDSLRRIEDEGLSGRLAADVLLYRRAAALDGLKRFQAAASDYRRLARTWPSSSLAAGALARAETLDPAGSAWRPAGPVAYEVRSGVFSDRNSAEEAADALRKCGFRPRIALAPAAREERFVVSIGRFDFREDAERAAREVERAGFPARVAP